TKDKVKFYKTPDSILKAQLEIYDEIVKKKSADNPLFKEIVESQIAFARRATQREQDTFVNRKMAFDYYFGPKGTAKKTCRHIESARHRSGRRPDGALSF